ncbi:MAG: hypothetical protein K2P39_04270 [Lachnospiraceae bacterium]|nr:hypothetical protein [Lachnospiraceae bacterium]
MDEIIGDREAKRDATDTIREKYGVSARQDAAQNCTVFVISQDAGQNDAAQECALKLRSRSAAMRRNPAVFGMKRPLCMADIERTETGLLWMPPAQEGVLEEHGQAGQIRRARGGEKDQSQDTQAAACIRTDQLQKLLLASLSYQNQLCVPLCLVENAESSAREKAHFRQEAAVSDRPQLDAETLRRAGFEAICDRPHYVLNTQTISAEMLRRAAAGEAVSIPAQDAQAECTLQAVAQEELLSLAHFVNARLCGRCGFFIIRSASYYERVQKELQSSGGGLFQIMENGVRRGCFACAGDPGECVREAVFDRACDQERCLVKVGIHKPAVLARVVNLQEMLRHICGSGKITVAIRITDPVIAQNDGLFIWYIDEKGSRMERVDKPDVRSGNDSSMRPEVTTTIGAFTAFLFAHMQLKENAKFDSIYLAGPAWLDEIAVR